MIEESKHDFRNGISSLAGILLRLNKEQRAIADAQTRIFTLFQELRGQILRVLAALEKEYR